MSEDKINEKMNLQNDSDSMCNKSINNEIIFNNKSECLDKNSKIEITTEKNTENLVDDSCIRIIRNSKIDNTVLNEKFQFKRKSNFKDPFIDDSKYFKNNSTKTLEEVLDGDENFRVTMKTLRTYRTNRRTNKSYRTKDTSETAILLRDKNIQIIKIISSLAIPSIFSSLIVFSIQTINLIFAGKIDTSSSVKQSDILNAIGLATIFLDFGGLLFGIGLTTSIETLCSQDFGKGNLKQMSKWCKICRYFMLIYFLFFALLCGYSKQIFISLDQPKEIAELASNYIKSQIPSNLFQFLIAIYTKFLASQQVYNPVLYINLCGLVLHPLWCYIFYCATDLDVIGLGLALDLSNFLILLSIFLYVKYYKYEIDVPWTDISYTECWKLVYTSFTCGLLHSIDSLGNELMSIIASYLPQDQLNAHICVLNIADNVNAISTGFGTAITTIVGNYMGRNKPKVAIKYAQVGSLMYFSFCVVLCSFFLFFHKYIAMIYIDDVTILKISSNLMRLVSIFLICDAMQFQFSSIARGIGKQTLGMIWGILIFLLFQTGLCILLFYVWKKSVYVLWTTQIIAGTIGMIVFAILLKMSDWKFLAKQIHEEENSIDDKNERKNQSIITQISTISDNFSLRIDNNRVSVNVHPS